MALGCALWLCVLAANDPVPVAPAPSWMGTQVTSATCFMLFPCDPAHAQVPSDFKNQLRQEFVARNRIVSFDEMECMLASNPAGLNPVYLQNWRRTD